MEGVLPALAPGADRGPLLVFVLSIGYYVTPQLLGGGSTVMVGQLIQRNVELFSSWGAASAVSVVLLAIVLALFLADEPSPRSIACSQGCAVRRPAAFDSGALLLAALGIGVLVFLVAAHLHRRADVVLGLALPVLPAALVVVRWYAEYFGSEDGFSRRW